jgi:hypothetical protein
MNRTTLSLIMQLSIKSLAVIIGNDNDDSILALNHFHHNDHLTGVTEIVLTNSSRIEIHKTCCR